MLLEFYQHPWHKMPQQQLHLVHVLLDVLAKSLVEAGGRNAHYYSRLVNNERG